MATSVPAAERTYQNHLLDSSRWRHFVPRDDDVVISTSLKSGTTWMQHIVKYLLLGTGFPGPLREVSVWLEMRANPLDETLARLEAQTHRRFLKSHLALDGLPFHPQVKYIVVGRDARDVFMSLWNHHTSYVESFHSALNDLPGRVGPPLPPPQQEIHAFWRNWITRGWFEWESEGYPYWGNLHHTRSWWPYRDLDNILFVHFNDLLADPQGEIGRVARFLDVPRSEEEIAEVARAASFTTMKANAEQLMGSVDGVWRGGAGTFIFKGTNGRWKEVLRDDELELYAEAAARVLTPEGTAWLERGRAALA